jgi:20S proteasome alpha/beta subunit
MRPPPPRPAPHPPGLKHRRLKRRKKAVTIAAGFKFKGGIMLCADSQFNHGGTLKTSGKKIFIRYFKKPKASIAFAIAGSVAHAQKAIRKICERINTIDSPTVAADSLVTAIEAALEPFYKDHIRTHPDYQKSDGPEFDLIIATWTQADGEKLYATSEDCCSEVEDYEFIGVGEYLARYLVKDIYQPTMNIMEITTLATEALLQTKDNVPDCGGNSEFTVLLDIANGSFGNAVDFTISRIEKFSQPFSRGLHEILFAVQNLDFDEEKVKAKFRDFESLLSTVRDEQKETRNARIALLNELSKPPAEPPKP